MAAGLDLAEVLEPLYASVLDGERLADFSAALCQATDSQVGAVMVHDATHARGRLDLLVGADPARMAYYEREFAADNLWMQRGQHLLRPGGISDSDDVVLRSELKRSRYYNEYLRMDGVEQSVALCARLDAQGVVTATLCRAGGQPYSEGELDLMRRVAPHWSNAYAILSRLSWLESQVSSLKAAVEAAPMAMMMLDARQRVVRTNPAAEALLAKGDPLFLAGRALESRHDGAAFRQCLHEAVVGVPADGTLRRCAGTVVLKNDAGRRAVVANVHPLAGDTGGASAVLFLQPAGPGSGDLATTLRGLFNLTASEAALACALHEHGALPAAALACGIAPNSAQSRLKLIYDKTWERSQPALMRLLAAVAATVGPEPA